MIRRLLEGSEDTFHIKAQWPIRRLPLRFIGRIGLFRTRVYEEQNGRQHRLYSLDGVSFTFNFLLLANPYLREMHAGKDIFG